MANQILLKRASGSDPTASDLALGEIAIRTDNGKLFTKKDNGTVAEISGAGGGNNFFINTLSSSSGSGGGSASFNGTATRFVLSNPPNLAAQLLVSIDGVIQKPNTGTSPSEGFAVDGSDIIFSSAPASGADFFIVTYASLALAEPSDNTVTSAKIVDGAIVNADINASAAIAGTKISPNFGSQDITGSKLTINSTTPTIEFPESDGNPDYRLLADGGVFVLQDQTNSASRFTVTTSVMAVKVNLAAEAGLDVTGNITTTGNLTIQSEFPKIELIDTNNNDDFEIRNANGLFVIRDATNNVDRLSINSSGFTSITGDLFVSNHIELSDNSNLKIGNNDDLEIFHDGSTASIIKTKTGDQLTVRSDLFWVRNSANSESIIKGIADGAVELYYDNSKKFETTSTGVTVTGALATTSLSATGGITGTGGNFILGDSSGTSDDRIKLGASGDLHVYHDGTDTYVSNATGDLRLFSVGGSADDVLIRAQDDIELQPNNGEAGIKVIAGGAAELYYANSKKFETTTYGVKVTGRLAATTSITGADNVQIKLGDSDDLQIYHTGSHSIIRDAGTGNLQIAGSFIQFTNAAITSTGLTFNEGGAVELYFDGSKKFETTSTGTRFPEDAYFVGAVSDMQWDSSETNLKFFDNVKAVFGGGSDLQIFHNGSDSKIVNSTGSLDINGSGNINIGKAGENGVKVKPDNAVELYYDNSKKLSTINEGVEIKGSLYPETDNLRDLGSSSKRWRDIYTNDLNLSNEGGANDVDGTWGSYTIQEGAEDLFLVNKRNGKKYKFNLTEVS